MHHASRSTAPFVFLDFPRDGLPPLRLEGTPERIITATGLDEVRPALREVEAATQAGYYGVGYLSYESAPAFDSAMQVHGKTRLPLLWFALIAPRAHGSEAAETWTGRDPGGTYTLGEWEPLTTRSDYDDGIARIHAAIARGDTYQANYTLRLRAAFEGDDFAYFRRLRAVQQPSYSAYLNLGRYRVLSVSPELFIHRREGRLTTKPMKGTVRRGYTVEEDRALAGWLTASEKDRAENVMIVDLLRNDLSRVAALGSVRVPRLFEIEKYGTIFQMTSTVTATADPDLTLETLMAAIFPCGSITGAPKISTMRLLRSLEALPREVYCGAIGVVCPDGEALFNVAIRTVWIDQEEGMAEYGTGGGITWDSVAQAEYDEALAKAAVLGEAPPDFDLIETVRLQGGEYTLLGRHLARLEESAAYFDFPFDAGALGEALAAFAGKEESHGGARRVRLRLSRQGEISIEGTALIEARGAYPVALHRRATFRQNRFLYHKTTHREVYERARADHPEAWDVLLRNERGELMEFTIGNVVLELNGRRYTPPVSSGLLPGTFRAELLQRGEIEERVLTPAALEQATRVWLINSVRGWVEVTFEPSIRRGPPPSS